jgi:hypothetical protein
MNPNPRALNNSIKVKSFLNALPSYRYWNPDGKEIVAEGSRVVIKTDRGTEIASLQFSDEWEARDYATNPFRPSDL